MAQAMQELKEEIGGNVDEKKQVTNGRNANIDQLESTSDDFHAGAEDAAGAALGSLGEKNDSNLPKEDIYDGDVRGIHWDGKEAKAAEKFDLRDLELIESALLTFCKHQRTDSQPSCEPEYLENGVDGGSEAYPRSSQLLDVEEVEVGAEFQNSLSKLLKKVQAAKVQKTESSGSHESFPLQDRGIASIERFQEGSLRELLEASSRAAMAAAKAAESVANNSQTIEVLVRALVTSRADLNIDKSATKGKVDKDESQQGASIEVGQEESLLKNLEKQNKITHWVLGFMVVSSALWRFGVVKFVLNLQSSISNPFQHVSSMFETFKEEHKSERQPQIKMPSILPSNDKEQNVSENQSFLGLGGFLPTEQKETN